MAEASDQALLGNYFVFIKKKEKLTLVKWIEIAESFHNTFKQICIYSVSLSRRLGNTFMGWSAHHSILILIKSGLPLF